MNIEIQYLEDSLEGRITTANEVTKLVWNRIKDIVIHIQPDADMVDKTIICEWPTILSILPDISQLRASWNFTVNFDEEAKKRVKEYKKEYKAARDAEGSLTVSITADEITARLTEVGYTKRELKHYQMRDVAALVSLPHGANFSVPGAGKTSVALATHLLTRKHDTILLVVAPKNAFPAWDEVISECLNPNSHNADITGFTRLVSGTENIEHLLELNPTRMIISYDQLIRSTEAISRLLKTRQVHVILDESHRMKAGENSLRGATLLSLSHLAARRDILSGTPIPRSIEDIQPQMDFLWPGIGLGLKAVSSQTPHEILKNFYVRTTKHELGLPPVTRHYEQVEMSAPQLALYGLLRQEVLKRLTGIKSNSNIDLIAARRSIMRLLQASSNPLLVVRSMTNEDPDTFNYSDTKIEAIFTAIVQEYDSPKILRACEIARELVGQGQRCVIWANFRQNVERISELLSDLGATYIHGRINAGSTEDSNTREGRVHRFHDSESGCMVLVANPAACSEGISLHRVCHNAIYLERNFNAAHYLQSVDRIHRLGLDPNQETNVYILESVAPNITGAVDFSVRRRMIEKLHIMSVTLNDTDLHQLALDEEEADLPLNYDITLDDLKDIIDELTGSAPKPGEEED